MHSHPAAIMSAMSAERKQKNATANGILIVISAVHNVGAKRIPGHTVCLKPRPSSDGEQTTQESIKRTWL